MPACKDCFFSHPSKIRQTIGAKALYECRYGPPAALPMQRVNDVTKQIEIGTMSAFPPVAGDLFCGKFKNKN